MRPGRQSQTGLEQYILDWVLAEASGRDHLPVLMISGAQGIGKSTALGSVESLDLPRIAVLGLDDVYHTRQTRTQLARTVHPLCETRGPPGTHDLPLLLETIARLKDARTDTVTRLPRFDKLSDDRMAQADWRMFHGRPDVLVIEGWMMGVGFDPASGASRPLNPLEFDEDPDGAWRAWQEQSLETGYEAIWDLAGSFLHLDAPSFDAVLGWRMQQEETTLGLKGGTLPPEHAAWVARFIQHFERLTRRMLEGKRRPGTILRLDSDRRILGLVEP